MQLVWITLKISNEITGFVRIKIRMITKIYIERESYLHFHKNLKA